MLAVSFDQRFAQAIWVFMQLLERAALRADESMTQHVIAVATYARNFVAFHRDFKTARCFTERTRSIDDSFLVDN